MRLRYSKRASESFKDMPAPVRRAFYKQAGFLLENLQHPSLHAKKYNEARGIWQARVNRGWRFYFTIDDDVYNILDVIPHPK